MRIIRISKLRIQILQRTLFDTRKAMKKELHNSVPVKLGKESKFHVYAEEGRL